MKKISALLLSFVALSSLCACQDNPTNSNLDHPKDTTSIQEIKPEQEVKPLTNDEMAELLLTQGIELLEAKGYTAQSCNALSFYVNDDLTLVATQLYYQNEASIVNCEDIYGLFDTTTLLECYDSDSLKKDSQSSSMLEKSPTELTATNVLCSSIGIQTYDDMWEELVTYLACDYLMEYMNYLINPYTVEINAIDCYINHYNDEIWFTVNLSAENTFGGKVTETIGNTRISPLILGQTDYIDNVIADFAYYHDQSDDEAYAKEQDDSFRLDRTLIEKYILSNY